ncbi:PucR family transcriptional regulator [Streptomyces violens]|uniref:PucR family transcriptional regulator n=1 Tax=Streptomyces violens TaxID=66377 RepID=UPI00056BDB16|nr:helix-turn-helix domain-containing protein [Streptomyces violens]
MEASAQYGSSAILSRVVERLGATLLSWEAGRPDPGRTVTSVVLYDPLDPPAVAPGTFVLGAGLASPEEIAAAIRSFARDGAIALVLREPVPHGPLISAALADTSMAVYGLARGASWMHVATLVTATLSTVSPDELMLGGHDSGTDLFELANSLAALLDAPVTIEDLSSRVIAFSSDQSGADEGRHRTILSMQAPTDVGELQRRHGLLLRIHESDRPVYITDVMEGAMPRVAVRVRAGEEPLGAIWAVVKGPLTKQREQGMREAAQVVALTMLRARLGADAAMRLRLGLVLSLLDGGPNARKTARQLNFANSPICVLALGASVPEGEDPSVVEADQQRTANALAMYLKPICPRATAALIGSVLYAVLPLRSTGEPGKREASRIADEFIARLDSSQTYFAGVGTVVADATDLAFSRSAADAALRVVRHRAAAHRRVAALEDVQVEHILLRVADAMADERMVVGGPLRALREYDAEHGGSMVETLRAWLDAFGDVTKAAETVRVHKNTFRYRLSRLGQIADVDLSDPDVRFALSLQLRIFE